MEKNKNSIKTLAGIVTYNPDEARLLENVSAIYPQTDKVVIFDNGSKNLNAFKKTLKEFDEITYIEVPENQGVAKGLSEIMNFAIENKYDWVLTLDDDSVARPNLIENYKKYIGLSKVAAMTCKMEDRNYPMNEKDIGAEYKYERHVITSGCFMSVEAYKNTDGYSIDLFIDRVDNDICYNLELHGYKIIKINYIGLLHEMGFGEIRRFLWHKARAVNYSPLRRYYIFRNEVIIRNKYPTLFQTEWTESGRPMWVNFILSSIKILLYENRKIDKITASWKGWRDGKIYVKDKKLQ